jgi:organic hydroperoxide reductase OsmC/OhrA
MISYPMSFYAQAESPFGIDSLWKLQSQNMTASCAVPPEFEGPGGAFSPEDLFVQALTNCFIATFKVYTEKSKVQFAQVSVTAELIVDLNESKKPVMKKCLLKVKVAGCPTPERIKTLAEKALSSGFVINSVKTEVQMELEIA